MAIKLFFKINGQKMRTSWKFISSDLDRQCGEGNLNESVLLKIFEKKTLQYIYIYIICNIYIYISYFHKFSVQDHLHEHYCTFKHLVGGTLIEIESAVAKQTKNVQFCFFQNILPGTIFYPHERNRYAFSGLLRDGGKDLPLPKICQIYPAIMKLGTLIPYLKRIHKIYK